MDTIFIILGILLVAGGVMIYFVKAGKIKDSDRDLIPDAVEDAVEEVKETVAEARARAKDLADFYFRMDKKYGTYWQPSKMPKQSIY